MNSQNEGRLPNIVFIFADQMRAHVLGCYGNTFVHTPHLDEMAASGVVLDNMISIYPLCSPYRAMLLTGRYPMANGTVSNDTGMRDDLPTIATAFKSQGYYTGYIGKWHLESNRDPFVPRERRQGFEYWAVNNCTHQYMDHFYCTETPEEIHFEGYDAAIQTNLAIDFIEENQNRPFCLFVSWGPPHDPYDQVPEEYRERISLDRIELRENVAEREVIDHLMERDEPDEETAVKREMRRAILDNNDRLKEALQGYYAHTAALDDYVGRIRESLRKANLADDTILVFTSDHGDMIGSHWMIQKNSPFEESIRVPFLVEYPGKVPAGGRSDALIAPIDLMPSLLALAGIECPETDGEDMSNAMRGESSDNRDALLLMKLVHGGVHENAITPWRGVRTMRHTYAYLFDHGPWLLYDNQVDPYQMKNLVDDPEHAALRESLEAKMRELMEEASDPGDTDRIHALREVQRLRTS